MLEKRVKKLSMVLNNYRKSLEKKIEVRKMILFGSYARGNPRDYSDVDLAVVSPDFQGGTEEDYLLLARAAREITPLIEAFPYTPRDLKNRKRGDFLDEILKNGKVIYQSTGR